MLHPLDSVVGGVVGLTRDEDLRLTISCGGFLERGRIVIYIRAKAAEQLDDQHVDCVLAMLNCYFQKADRELMRENRTNELADGRGRFIDATHEIVAPFLQVSGFKQVGCGR